VITLIKTYIEGEDGWYRPTKLHIIFWSMIVAIFASGLYLFFFFIIGIIPFLIIDAWFYKLDILLIYLLIYIIGFVVNTVYYLFRVGREEVLLVKCDQKTYEKMSREIGPMFRQFGYEIWSRRSTKIVSEIQFYVKEFDISFDVIYIPGVEDRPNITEFDLSPITKENFREVKTLKLNILNLIKDYDCEIYLEHPRLRHYKVWRG
jgi:hypothetical protein